MLNEKKIEEIRNKIQMSGLLTDHEKADWLNLLELMNDKQLGELEEILGGVSAEAGPTEIPPSELSPPLGKSPVPPPAPVKPFQSTPPLPKPVAPKPPAPPPAPPHTSSLPPLTHIANIPTDVTMAHAVPTPPPPPASAKPTPPPGMPSKPADKPSATAAPTRPSITQPRFKIEKIEEIQGMSVDTIRSFDLQSVVDTLRALIQEHGYFKVLQLLESSPLYDSYINSGKERLRPSSHSSISDNSLLTQEELEFMTDLRMHMRFNRW